MTTVSEYYDTIVGMLQGKSEALRDVPPERLDWTGIGAVLDLYEKALSPDRDAIVSAMGQIIEGDNEPSDVIAQVVYIATSLDIVHVAPSVQKLSEKSVASEEPIRSVVTNYIAYRGLRTSLPHS